MIVRSRERGKTRTTPSNDKSPSHLSAHSCDPSRRLPRRSSWRSLVLQSWIGAREVRGSLSTCRRFTRAGGRTGEPQVLLHLEAVEVLSAQLDGL